MSSLVMSGASRLAAQPKRGHALSSRRCIKQLSPAVAVRGCSPVALRRGRSGVVRAGEIPGIPEDNPLFANNSAFAEALKDAMKRQEDDMAPARELAKQQMAAAAARKAAPGEFGGSQTMEALQLARDRAQAHINSLMKGEQHRPQEATNQQPKGPAAVPIPEVARQMDVDMTRRVAHDTAEAGGIEDLLEHAVGNAKMNINQWTIMRDQLDSMLGREKSQLERLSFALDKAKRDAAYYRTLQSLQDGKLDAVKREMAEANEKNQKENQQNSISSTSTARAAAPAPAPALAPSAPPPPPPPPPTAPPRPRSPPRARPPQAMAQETTYEDWLANYSDSAAAAPTDAPSPVPSNGARFEDVGKRLADALDFSRPPAPAGRPVADLFEDTSAPPPPPEPVPVREPEPEPVAEAASSEPDEKENDAAWMSW